MQYVINKFEILYDRYCPMLYGIALQIAPTQMEAEQIIISSFIKAYHQNIEEQKYPSPCISLIKLLIQTAHEQLKNNTDKPNFELKMFENSPMLHHVLCEQATLEKYCIEYKITKQQVMKNFREEFSEILKTKTKTTVNPLSILKIKNYKLYCK